MNLQFLLIRVDKIVQAIQSRELLLALVRHRVLAAAEHRQVLRPNLAAVVDIGANRGQFSLAVRRWAPAARIFAFEPLAEPAARFQEVFKKDKLVNLFQAAIGPEQGDMVIHVSAADDSSSLLPISGLQKRLFPGTGEVRTEIIKVGRLADYLPTDQIMPPALLKLDVQGYELEALRGCEELLNRFAYIYVECSFVELYTGQPLADDIIEWLRERGFKLNGIYNFCYDKNGQAVQGDFLFKHLT